MLVDPKFMSFVREIFQSCIHNLFMCLLTSSLIIWLFIFQDKKWEIILEVETRVAVARHTESADDRSEK